MRTMRNLLLVLVALLCAASVTAQRVSVTLAPVNGVAGQGGTLCFSATVTNNSGQPLYLNSPSINFSDPSNLSPDPSGFFDNFFGYNAASGDQAPLANGASVTNALIFAVPTDLTSTPGTYHGSIAILGGSLSVFDPNYDGSTDVNLGQVDFTVQVVTNTPPKTSITSPTDSSTYCTSSVTFAWSGSVSYGSASYKPNLTYRYALDGQIIGPTPITTFIQALPDGQHTFAVTAIDAAGNADPNPPTRRFVVDTLAPSVSDWNVSQVTDSQAAIVWKSNKPTNSQLKYRIVGAANWSQTNLNQTLVVGHGVVLSGLSPQTSYEYCVISSDSCGRQATGSLATFQTLPDTTAPAVGFTAGPRDNGASRPGNVVFSWAGVDDVTPSNLLTYETSLDNGAWTPTLVTTTTLNFPNNGSHIFSVRAIDQAGNRSTSPAVVHFSIDGVPPNILSTSVSDITFYSAIVHVSTDKQTTVLIQYIFDDGSAYNSTYVNGDGYLATSHAVTIGPLGADKKYKARVMAYDAAGNQTVSSDIPITTAKLADLSVSVSDITFSNPAPADGASITMSAKIHNTGGLAMTGTVVFYDIAPNGQSAEVGRATVTIPAYAANEPTVTSNAFTVGEGVHRPYVQIINTTPSDNIPSNNGAQQYLTVGGPACRFSVSGANPLAWPGSSGLFTVFVKNTGSATQTLNTLTFTGPSWVTLASTPPASLDPGQETQLTFRINAPSDLAGGVLGHPLYIPFSVSIPCPGATFAANLNIEAYAQPIANMTVTVVDDTTGNPIPNAAICLDTTDTQYVTGLNGRPINNAGAFITIPTQNNTGMVYAIAQDYLPSSATVDTNNPVVIRLKPGKPLEVTAVTVTPLTLEQIIARGVNLADPNNYFVYDFEIRLKIGPLIVPNVVVPVNFPGGYSVGGCTFCGGGGFGGGGFGGGGYTIFYNITYPVANNPIIHTETWIIIPGDVRILKQFWDATVIVRNNTPYNINNVLCSLIVPSGLSLPDLFGQMQPVTQSLGTIDGMTMKQASWTVRGDIPGTGYTLRGTATGDIQLGGGSVPLSDSLLSAPFDVAEPKVALTFHTPAVGTILNAGGPFQIGIDVTNLSTIDLQLVIADIKANMLKYCHLAPGEPATKSLGSIAKGATKGVTFNFISDVTGIVDEVATYVTGPNFNPPVGVTPVNNPVPTLSAVASSKLVAGAGTTTINLTGSNFVPSSIVHWTASGVTTNLATTFLSAGKLSAVVPAALTAKAGSASVTVSNPAPGGGFSGAQTVTIIGTPQLSVTVMNITRGAAGVTVSYTVTNTGTADAVNVKINGARIVGGATVAQSSGLLALAALGGSYSGVVTFPTSTPSGSRIFQVSGTTGGASFSLSKSVLIP